MTRSTTQIRLTTAFLLGGLLLFSSCKKNNDADADVVPVFPDRPEVRFESNQAGQSTAEAGSENSVNQSSTSGSEVELDQTGSIRESGTVPPEAQSAETIPELPNITFDLNSDQLSEDMKALLQRHIDFLQDNQTYYVVLRGHTDEQGTDEYNYSLGQRRATTIRDYLVENGIQIIRLSTLSYGEDYPLLESTDEESYAQNRRVEFLVYEVMDP